MSKNDVSKVANKIIKKLKSKDDNDKLAALAYLTKVFPTPEDLSKSEYSRKIWESLRSTQFLERALRSENTQGLVFMILSVFSHFCPADDLIPFVPLLSKLIQNDYGNDASQCLIEISQRINDVSILFEYNEINRQSLEFFTRSLINAKNCKLTPAVFNARSTIFSFLSGNEDLEIRKILFILVSHLIQANDSFAIYASKSKIDLPSFLAIQRIALIELRLQLDVPTNYKELEENEKQRKKIENEEAEKTQKTMNKKTDDYEINLEGDDDDDEPVNYENIDNVDIKDLKNEKKVKFAKNDKNTNNDENLKNDQRNEKIEPIKFTQKIGPLINPDLSSASCQILEFLVSPLVNHDEELNDSEVSQYFECIDSIINETVSIFKAVVGQRDHKRPDLKCLISLFAKWLRDGPFLCESVVVLAFLKQFLSMLWWFPEESIQYIPVMQTWSESDSARPLMKAGFNELSKKMLEVADEEEKEMINELIKIVYN
ncbi:hypothetical protein TRFO_14338 [Tritrichomonas foetus]|uniref:Uncharacterized protein n=1 Tax=Tritrichomonas foetus TaxID=1144522 RepID=A0A1J4KZY7_9EUKA|nr:hypothetical protein TRFO_14338 [Tritrichomonas foetus]|eukprot:OHT15165.1 hypothetical protein TRFO_14338 [Tritrichomonas foetus]